MRTSERQRCLVLIKEAPGAPSRPCATRLTRSAQGRAPPALLRMALRGLLLLLLPLCAPFRVGAGARTPLRPARGRVATAVAQDIPTEVELTALTSKWRREEAAAAAATSATATASASGRAARSGNGTEGGRGSSELSSERLRSARARFQQALDEAQGVVQPNRTGQWAVGLPYDPALASARFASRPLLVARRQFALLTPLLAFLGRVALDVRAGKEEAHRPERAAELRALITDLGPAIIKAGQALSSRSDLLPAEYLRELTKLQDQVPPFDTAAAFEIIEAELGAPLLQAYKRVDAAPIAAASLGQVRSGELQVYRHGTAAWCDRTVWPHSMAAWCDRTVWPHGMAARSGRIVWPHGMAARYGRMV